MSNQFNHLDLDPENLEFNEAVDFVHNTNSSLYLTGKAGSGKTTFLKYIKKTTKKNAVIVAPTGIAAINAGGQTIHSFFQIPFSPFIQGDPRLDTKTKDAQNYYQTFQYRKKKRKVIQELELLIIDEVSMVRCDIIDVIDRILRIEKRQRDFPFGGVQVLFIGDAFQLPPIINDNQWNILCEFYDGPFFFNSWVFDGYAPSYIELKKIYRQKEQGFIDLLNRVRTNEVTDNDISMLNGRLITPPSDDKEFITLATHNIQVNQTNARELEKLQGDIHEFEATISGDFPSNNFPAEHFLRLKEGAQIMFLKNDYATHKRYYNGKIGVVQSFTDDGIVVSCSGEDPILVEKAAWEHIIYEYDREEKKITEKVKGTFTQYPLRLAWSVTVHKSQGLSFPKLIADVQGAFVAGQVYVALSRCTTFSGLILKSPIHRNCITSNPMVIEFAKKETNQHELSRMKNDGKADLRYRRAIKEFNNGEIKKAVTEVIEAINLRDDLDSDMFRRFVRYKMIKGMKLEKFDANVNPWVELEKEMERALNMVKLILRETAEQNIPLDRATEELNNLVHLESKQ
ncbi:MAG: AAA family ATPase [Flavobacteriales bacterium]|nr:AAA family ATPase [Flavobacteriales bacterium]